MTYDSSYRFARLKYEHKLFIDSLTNEQLIEYVEGEEI